jgi:hypothetical protein
VAATRAMAVATANPKAMRARTAPLRDRSGQPICNDPQAIAKPHSFECMGSVPRIFSGGAQRRSSCNYASRKRGRGALAPSAGRAVICRSEQLASHTPPCLAAVVTTAALPCCRRTSVPRTRACGHDWPFKEGWILTKVNRPALTTTFVAASRSHQRQRVSWGCAPSVRVNGPSFVPSSSAANSVIVFGALDSPLTTSPE